MTSPVRNRKSALVVFLDILGFGRKVVNIQTDKDADGIYKILSFIRDEFESRIDDKTAKEHGLQGKEVLAFSDSVVISLYFDSIDTRGMGLFDNMLAHIFIILHCVI